MQYATQQVMLKFIAISINACLHLLFHSTESNHPNSFWINKQIKFYNVVENFMVLWQTAKSSWKTYIYTSKTHILTFLYKRKLCIHYPDKVDTIFHWYPGIYRCEEYLFRNSCMHTIDMKLSASPDQLNFLKISMDK